MTHDLNLIVEITTVPMARESNDLAMSSRTSYLSSTDCERACCLNQGLFAAEAACGESERNSRGFIEIAQVHMPEVGQLQYLALRDARTFDAVQDLVERPAILCVAANVGATCLIDNAIRDPNSGKLGKGNRSPEEAFSAILGNSSSGVL